MLVGEAEVHVIKPPKSTGRRESSWLTDQSIHPECKHSGRSVAGPRLRCAAAVLRAALLAALLAAAAAPRGGCERQGHDTAAAPAGHGAKATDKQAAAQLGFPIIATRNTTRVSGSDPPPTPPAWPRPLPGASPTRARPPSCSWTRRLAGRRGRVHARVRRRCAPRSCSPTGRACPPSPPTRSRAEPKGAQPASGAQAILVGDMPGRRRAQGGAHQGSRPVLDRRRDRQVPERGEGQAWPT